MKPDRIRIFAVLAVLTGCLCVPGAAPAADLVKITAYPGNIQLNTKRDRQSVIVQALYSNGLSCPNRAWQKHESTLRTLFFCSAGAAAFVNRPHKPKYMPYI